MWVPVERLGGFGRVACDLKSWKGRSFDPERPECCCARMERGMPEEPLLYVFQCPLTGMTVKVLANAAATAPSCRQRWNVACAACGQRHVINIATGRVRVTVASPTPQPTSAG